MPLVVLVAGLALGAADPPNVRADVGVASVDPRAAQPGDVVRLTVGCGGCKSAYIVNGPAHPPRSFPISLVPIAKAPKDGACPNGESGICAPGSVGAPRGPPFVPVGRARPTFRERDLARTPTPRYRLRFRVPRLAAGEYVFVLYCASCYDGPQGSLIAEPRDRSERLRVLSPAAPSNGNPVALLDAFVALLNILHRAGENEDHGDSEAAHVCEYGPRLGSGPSPPGSR